MSMPPVKWQASPNFNAGAIKHDLFFFHCTQGSYAGAKSWLCNPVAKASAHLIIPATVAECTQLVDLRHKAWCQRNFNGRGVSLEIEGWVEKGLSVETTKGAARIAAWICIAYKIPPVWAKGGQGRGVCQHIDLGKDGGNHHDIYPIGSPRWLDLMDEVKKAHEELSRGPLPAFPLRGLPEGLGGGTGAGEASAGGERPVLKRGSKGAAVKELQTLLGGLVADGAFGPATEEAVKRYQGAQKLIADGIVGPITWEALLN